MRELAPRLGLGGALVTSAAPFFRAGTKARPGVQVGMMLQTKKSVWVVEIKGDDGLRVVVAQALQGREFPLQHAGVVRGGTLSLDFR